MRRSQYKSTLKARHRKQRGVALAARSSVAHQQPSVLFDDPFSEQDSGNGTSPPVVIVKNRRGGMGYVPGLRDSPPASPALSGNPRPSAPTSMPSARRSLIVTAGDDRKTRTVQWNGADAVAASKLVDPVLDFIGNEVPQHMASQADAGDALSAAFESVLGSSPKSHTSAAATLRTLQAAEESAATIEAQGGVVRRSAARQAASSEPPTARHASAAKAKPERGRRKKKTRLRVDRAAAHRFIVHALMESGAAIDPHLLTKASRRVAVADVRFKKQNSAGSSSSSSSTRPSRAARSTVTGSKPTNSDMQDVQTAAMDAVPSSSSSSSLSSASSFPSSAPFVLAGAPPFSGSSLASKLHSYAVRLVVRAARVVVSRQQEQWFRAPSDWTSHERYFRAERRLAMSRKKRQALQNEFRAASSKAFRARKQQGPSPSSAVTADEKQAASVCVPPYWTYKDMPVQVHDAPQPSVPPSVATQTVPVAVLNAVPQAIEHSSIAGSRKLHTMTSTPVGLLLLGGQNGEDKPIALDTLSLLDPTNNEWVALPSQGASPGPLLSHAATYIALPPPASSSSDTGVSAGAVLVVGGTDQQSVSNAVHLLELDTCTWHQLPSQGTSLPPRFGHSLTALDALTADANPKTFALFGGRDATRVYGDLYILTVSPQRTKYNVSYRKLRAGGDIPPPRAHHTAMLLKNELFLFGGVDPSTAKLYNDCYRFSFASTQWTQVCSQGRVPSPRFQHSLTFVDNKLLLLGGQNFKEALNDCYAFDPSSSSWEAVALLSPPLPMPEARCGHSAALILYQDRNVVVVYGGARSPSELHLPYVYCVL